MSAPGPAVRIRAAADAVLRAAAARAYPEEGCGVLVGSPGDPEMIESATIGTNLRRDRPRDRYEIDPADIIRAEREARARGLEVLGFWHSHPDAPARPSAFDTDHAWTDYVYLITSTAPDGARDLRAHRLEAGAPGFLEVPLEVTA